MLPQTSFSQAGQTLCSQSRWWINGLSKRLGQRANCTNTHKHPERTLAYRTTYLHCCRSLPLVTSARVWIQLFPGRTRIILCDKKNSFARVLFLQVLTQWTLTHIRGLQGLDDPNVFFLPGSLNLFFQQCTVCFHHSWTHHGTAENCCVKQVVEICFGSFR